MSIEHDSYSQYKSQETKWLKSYVQTGVFHELSPRLLEMVHEEIDSDPKDYLLGVLKFELKTFDKGIMREKVDQNARVYPKVYVSRLIPQTNDKTLRGVGYNIVFSPGDPSFTAVEQVYKNQLQKLSVDEHTMPFGVLWSETYYYRGNSYYKGEWEGEGGGEEVFGYWDMVWHMILCGAPAFFKLDAPYSPPNAEQILKEIIESGSLNPPKKRRRRRR